MGRKRETFTLEDGTEVDVIIYNACIRSACLTADPYYSTPEEVILDYRVVSPSNLTCDDCEELEELIIDTII